MDLNDKDWGAEAVVNAVPLKITAKVDLTTADIDSLYTILDIIEWNAGQHPVYQPLIKLVEAYIIAAEKSEEDVVAAAKRAKTHIFKWEGEVCDTQGCKHSSNEHSGQKGLCCRESCHCMRFVPSGKML